ncbi:4-diphosphocytidyl-2-C-methyl-D-erythritol kinase [Actinomyces bovis]|uniref:4-diphosphocytidyl-2-C-methyl-D-erythritol kinase n=1 Tax=Actinomyces bovis TaxID=1658 RepID=A0ABY1VNS9_9ACTO|nr:4-(cytidine 5'-diphospho)-2-C-methyl-D-erythritol kinase [Actinomyces bovis]SPT53112.1 4-diphosphocytidyl-2-C-methyl-D-erythritol kinase [Actinomyces bovis]VEG52244.1 4-diphosphocytidyl-2-C-methyl-D-erythritol kinase [Actinomyces israelii]
MSHLCVVPADSGSPERRGSLTSVRVEAPGKVNLYLSCGAPAPDGYHPLITVFQAVRLIERVTARRQSADAVGQITLSLEEPDPRVPLDASNLAVRAAALLAKHAGVSEGVDLLLRKRVPVAGGMAGGSADAAATLLACNALWGTGLDSEELIGLAARLGADVPFPLAGFTALGHGRGDQLSPLMAKGRFTWVFALAKWGLSTPDVFKRFDKLLAAGELPGRTGASEPAPVPESLTAALRTGDVEALAAGLHNDLQPAALSLRPELESIIATAEAAGALRAIVSGSGPTIAALVPDSGAATVARALETLPMVAGTVRADAPVAGARVVR